MATGLIMFTLELSHQQIRRLWWWWWWWREYIWIGRLRGNCIWGCLECSWIVRSKRETERLPRVFWEAAIHHQCSKFKCHMQDLTLFLTTKAAAAAAPPHGEEEGRPGGACCYVSVCTRNSTSPKKNFFCCTPHFYPKCTGWKRRRYSEITAMVSFFVLLLSVCLPNAFFSWFVCGKMLTSYLRKEIERLDAFYAGRSTSSRLLCDQTT